MAHLHNLLLILGLAITLAACTPAATDTRETTAAVTAVVSTAEPVPSDSTPIPTLAAGLSPAELKYRLLDQFPNFFFCDPDHYPIERGDEAELAHQRFPELQADAETFNAILAHHNLTALTTYSDEQKLLIYREYKKLTAIPLALSDGGYRFQIQVAETEGEGELVTGLIDGQGVITVQERTAAIAACPICLAAGTRISTPTGSVPVQNLRPGMWVWTLNRTGARVARPLVRVSQTIVPFGHQVVHLRLDDGRQLWLSPSHPTADGRSAGHLRSGQALDGAIVLSAELVPYGGVATYDLLPAGETGYYWANGILLASTLEPPT